MTAAFVAMAFCAAHATVRPNRLFSDNAVLQQGIEIPVWGTSGYRETVTVEFDDQKIVTTATNGKWRVNLKSLKAGGPFTMTVTGGNNTVTAKNILVGEVWVCSGQSNMTRNLGLRNGQKPLVNWEKEAAEADYPEIRHFQVCASTSDEPIDQAYGKWVVCSPTTVQGFTAVGYFFGRDLNKALKLPVGLIHSSVGGTPAEAWMRKDALERNPELKVILDWQRQAVATYPAILERYKVQEASLQEKFTKEAALAQSDGKALPEKPEPPPDPARSFNRPCGLYNFMIAPLQPYAIRGVAWYQGEANYPRPKQYRTLFPALIANWREAWGQGEFPFLFVQIAPFKDIPPELREAQLLAWRQTHKTAMVVTTDCGDANDIHPNVKQPVGARLALAARAVAYGEPIEYSGPVFDSIQVQGARAVISFTHVGGGLVAKDGALKGFTIAGPDKNFVEARARITGNTIQVFSQRVKQPVAVRYGWSNVPDVNLFNKEGLPATPFRTDVE